MTPTDVAIAELAALWLGIFAIGIFIFWRWL
jgi:hypothetical protein